MSLNADNLIVSQKISANGINIHYREAGDGPSILLLHGFPDHSGVWRPMMAALAPFGRLIAPDQRGYNLTSRPKGEDAYRIENLVNDMIDFIDVLDLSQVVVCGHDWGGIIACHLAMAHPERISHLILLNSAHPYILQDMIWDDHEQRAASQYFKKLQADRASELFSKTRREEMIAQWFSKYLRSGQMSAEDVNEYREAWSRPGVWEAMLNWYRASPYTVPAIGDPAPEQRWTATLDYAVNCPVLVLWGEDDQVFVRGLVERFSRVVRDFTAVWLPSVGHVPQRDVPELCAEHIARFIKEKF